MSTQTSEAQTSGGGQTRRGDDAPVSYTVVLIHDDDDGAVSWQPLGEITAPARTQRGTVLRRLLEGQTRDGESGDVPQIPIEAGERGSLLLVPTLELGDIVPVSAREQIVFEVVA